MKSNVISRPNDMRNWFMELQSQSFYFEQPSAQLDEIIQEGELEIKRKCSGESTRVSLINSEFSVSNKRKTEYLSSEQLENLDETEIKRIVQVKMSALDYFNNNILTKEEKKIALKINLTNRQLKLLRKMQLFVRKYLKKRQFFSELKREKLKEQQANYLRLKASFEEANNASVEKESTFFSSMISIFNFNF